MQSSYVPAFPYIFDVQLDDFVLALTRLLNINNPYFTINYRKMSYSRTESLANDLKLSLLILVS